MEPAQPMAQAEEVAVVVVPFLAQGHLNQLLQLSLLLSARGLSVHFASSATHNRQAKTRVHGCDANSVSRIQFHDLPLPHLNFSIPPSDPHGHGHGHGPNNNFPSHLQPAFEATEHLRAPLAALLRSLSAASRRLVLIQDPLMSFAACDAASLPNAEIYNFQCVPAIFWLSSFWEHRGDHVAEPTPEALDVILASFEVTVPQEFIDVLDRRLDKTWEKASNLINTCRPIEGEFIDLLADLPAALRGNKTFAIGPLNPVTLKSRVDGNRRHGCLQWLDRQPPGSVVYVSFGTTSTMSEDQVEQLAIGLQRSGQRFIWVLRDADKGDIFADGEGDDKEQGRLPPGFETEVGGVGIVIRDWAPQLEILAHRATGVFMSHCGWNSCLESLGMGVPILAWPMHSDQPRNAMMMTEYLKVGVLVMEWARRERTVSAAEVEEAIKRVMVGSPEGEEMRRRAKELGEAVREAAADGGSSRAELDSFFAHITR